MKKIFLSMIETAFIAASPFCPIATMAVVIVRVISHIYDIKNK